MSNFDNNPYYGNGGGGFVQGGGSPYGSQESPGGGKKKGNNTIRPVTIKQILAAGQVHPDSDFSIDGHDIGQIFTIGAVRNISKTATNVSYEVGDGTGYVDVRQWLDSADDENGKMTGVEQDRYIAIIGTLKTFGGKRHVSATHIRVIHDSNEIFHHLLKALYVSLTLRNPGASSAINGGAIQGRTGQHSDYTAGGTNAAPGGGDTSQWAGLPPLQQKIMAVISKAEGDDGIHVASIARSITGADGDSVMNAVEILMADGHVFSTIDDLHVKAC